MLVLSSASHFVHHCACLDSSPSSHHYSSLYINGMAWLNLFQGASDVGEQPSGESPEAHQGCPSCHLQLSEADASCWGEKNRRRRGRSKYVATHPPLQFPSAVIVYACSCCRQTDHFLCTQEPAVMLAIQPTTKVNTAGGQMMPSSSMEHKEQPLV